MISKGVKICLWAYPFFGLTDKYKIHLHEILFDLTHYGKFQYDALYDMPVQYRTFYYKKLVDVKKQEQREAEKSNNESSQPSGNRGRR